MIRYGILGFGNHAVRRLMPGFAGAKRCSVAGFWRFDKRKAEETVKQYAKLRLRTFSSPEDLCASPDIDAIFVASPDALHLPHVLLAIEHHKPVLCEKPMGMNVAECERMVEAAERAGVLLGVAQNFRFERSVNRMREIIAGGIIGRPLLAQSDFHYPGYSSARTWITDPSLACGGPVGDVAVHCLDALRFILQDEITAVYARATYDAQSGAVECAAGLLLEFSGGPVGNVTVSTRSEYRTPTWITGETGVVGAEDALTVDHEINLQTRAAGRDPTSELISNEGTYAKQVDAFARSIEEKIPFASPGVEGLRNQRVLDAAYRSIRNGKREQI